MKTYKLDLHSHIPEINSNIKNYNKKVKNILKKLFIKKGNIVFGISDSDGNGRYKKFIKELKKIKGYEIDFKYEDYFVLIKKSKKVVYIIKADEIGTEKGHILIVGYDGKIKSRNLNDVLKEAHKQKCVVIANHPLHQNNLGYFLFSKLFDTGNKISLSKKVLKKHKKDFDALEENAYFPEDWKKIEKFSKKNKIPIISSSDAHEFDEFFKSYFEVKNLNFKNPKKFKKSLKKAIKKEIKLYAKNHGFEAKYEHAVKILFLRLLDEFKIKN